MKTYSTLKLTTLLWAILVLISLNSASAQWTVGVTGSSNLNDTLTVGNGVLSVTGTFNSADPMSLYTNYLTMIGTGDIVAHFGRGHYYQIQAMSPAGTLSPSVVTMNNNGDQYDIYTILDANLNIVGGFNTAYFGHTTSTFTLSSGSTYYVEVHFGSGNTTTPFQFTFSGGVFSAIQVVQNTYGASAGVASTTGALTGSDEPSHARSGSFADYYELLGAGTTDITMSGFDTFLYLYDKNFNLVAKNDDANPPGHGGSRIHTTLSLGSVAMSGTVMNTGVDQSEVSASNATITTTGTATLTSLTAINLFQYWSIYESFSISPLPPYILTYTTTLSPSVNGNISIAGTVSFNGGNGTQVTAGVVTLTSNSVQITSGSGTTIFVGNHATITVTSTNGYYGDPYTPTITIPVPLTITVAGQSMNMVTGLGTSITTGTGYQLVQQPFYVEATSYAKAVNGSYTISTTSGGLTPITSPWNPLTSSTTNKAVPMAFSTSGNLTNSTMSSKRSGSYASYYQLSSSSSGTVNIEVGGSIDTYLYLYDQNGSVLNYSATKYKSKADPYDCFISASLTSGQNYYIEVTTYRPSVGGNYNFTVSAPAITAGGSSGSVVPIAKPF